MTTPVRETFLPFSLPEFGDEERREVLEVLDSGWVTTGPRVALLETALQEYTGAAHAVCMSSCSAALHVALVLLDLKPGDEVITSPLTFCSTAHAIVHAGGTPVLADVEPDTLNLDPQKLPAAMTEKTRAIIPVHFGGHPSDMDAITEIARTRDLVVIEDAAHGLGSSIHGRPAGTLGDMGCFSFYATKNITTGEGGALVTSDAGWADQARRLAFHGMDRDAWKRYRRSGSWYYEVNLPGFKYNMTDLEAALGIHQIKKLPEFNRRRAEIASRYDAGFGDHPAIQIPTGRSGVDHARHLYPVQLRLSRLGVSRAQFIDELTAENIGSSVHFIPIHYHPYYRERLALQPGSYPVAETAYERLVSLPIYPKMSDQDVDDVVSAVRKIADRSMD